MIEIRYGSTCGPAVQCVWCKHPLSLESKTDYKQCVNCGYAYSDDNYKEKPMKWWYYKLLCEFWYKLHITRIMNIYGYKRYNYYLKLLCDCGFNLYGERILKSS